MVALLDITKCLYDAIARMERAAEKGNAIAAAVESVEREWSVKGSGAYKFDLYPSFLLYVMNNQLENGTPGFFTVQLKHARNE